MKKLLILIMLVLLSSLVYADYTTPVIVYDFSQTSGPLLNSIDNIDNASSFDKMTNKNAEGINGNAWEFEADNLDYITIGEDGSTIDSMGAMSINCWIKIEDYGDDMFVFNARNNLVNYDYMTYISTWVEEKGLWRVGTDIDYYAVIPGDIPRFNSNDWQMVSMTFDEGVVTAYHNSDFIGSVVGPGENVKAANFEFGRTWPADWNIAYFDGIMDECYIYAESLSQSDIDELYGGNNRFYPFVSDEDKDGVLDEDDKCPNTVEEQIVYGCSCKQILGLKPGNNKGELKKGCSKGTINVFTKQIGWAKTSFE